MKKFFSLSIAGLLTMSLLAGCGDKNKNNAAPSPEASPSAEESATPENDTETPEASTETTKVGLGQVVKVSKPKDASEEGDGAATIYSTVAAVAVDSEGKILSVTIDASNPEVSFDTKGTITTEKLEADYKSKREFKDDYGMKEASPIKKEWYEQVDSLEQWMVGKTIDEIKSVDPAEDTDLKTSVTIGLDDIIAATEEAINNAKESATPVVKTGLALSTNFSKTKGVEEVDGEMKDGKISSDTTMVAVGLDASDVIATVSIDVSQTAVIIDAEGKITSNTDEETITKQEKKDDYGMKDASEIGKEWYEQMTSLEEYMIGKSVKDVTEMPTFKKDDAHPSVPDTDDLKTSVTIDVGGYLSTLEKAVANAK